MSAEATGWCWKHSPFKGSHGKFLCHLAVADVVNDAHGNEFWMAQASLAAKVGVTRSTVSEFFADAIEFGLCELVDDNSKRGKANRYRLHMPLPVISDEKGVSAHPTPTPSEGVGSPDRGVGSSDRGVSAQPTGGVGSPDTELKGTQEGTQVELNPPQPPPQAGVESGQGDTDAFAASLFDEEVELAEIDAEERRGSLKVVEGGRFENALDRREQEHARNEKEIIEICNAVLDAWCDAVGRDRARVKLNGKRRRQICARLNEKYEPADLIAAVRGIAYSAWHMGDNPEERRYDDLDIALRSGDRVEKFRDLYERKGAKDGYQTDVVDRVFAKIAGGGIFA